MPTYTELRRESYWDREIVTPELDWLGDELCRRTGRPRVAFGTKGDNRHLKGSHRSQEWIRRSRYCTNRTYTVQAGLTLDQMRHIAGVDFTPGSVEDMITQSKRISTAMISGQLEGVREFYGNVDGDRIVDGWDNVRNRKATSDSSHLWHWHLGLDRRYCGDRALMERILAVVLGLEIDDMLTPKDIINADIITNPYGDSKTNETITLNTAIRNIGGDTRQTATDAKELKSEVGKLKAQMDRMERAIAALCDRLNTNPTDQNPTDQG